jgi:hypothetical protein
MPGPNSFGISLSMRTRAASMRHSRNRCASAIPLNTTESAKKSWIQFAVGMMSSAQGA